MGQNPRGIYSILSFIVFIFSDRHFSFNVCHRSVVIINAMQKKYVLLLIVISLILPLGLFSEAVTHHVQKGDTLYSISRKYNVSVDEIMELNGLTSPEQLKIGLNLKITSNNLDFNEKNGYIEDSEYFVKKGDTLYSISRRNGISVTELLERNSLSENHVLRIGEKLFLRTVNADPEPDPVLTGGNNINWPINGTRYKMDGKLEGIRINADAYSYVRSIAAGKVVLAEPYRGFGNVILIDVNGYIYLYGGNEDVFVNVGEEVTAGTRIGRLGMSDLSNGKKDMYFSVFKDGKPIDTNTAPRG
jgi:murein DD-endopeptidase MepM/ murein hydrolase activator NlpD